MQINPNIFRCYDIRGLVGTHLNDEVMVVLGQALGSSAMDQLQRSIVVGGDGRLSTPNFKHSLIKGLLDTGIEVIDIGQIPTPLLYYATCVLPARSGAMVTGSHNPPEYNGLKMVIDRKALEQEAVLGLRDRINRQQLTTNQTGTYKQADISERYINEVSAGIKITRPIKVVVDCGNGIAGIIAPDLFEALGCEVIPMYCEVDGRFPNHHPDPADPKNMPDLCNQVKANNADIGIAFDGDGDRLGVVTDSGRIIPADRLLMLFSQHVLAQNPNAEIIFDVKCSRRLAQLIERYGGRPVMWRTGHSDIKAKLRETGAPFGGEYSGHICFADRWYGFDDALYSAARLIEILAKEETSFDELFAAIPEDVCTPELKVPTTDEEKFGIVKKLQNQGHFDGSKINDIDGIRADYGDGWGLIRASNTSPTLTLRFEAENERALKRIYHIFSDALTEAAPHLEMPALP